MKSRRQNLHWGDLNMAELELEKLILHFEQSNKAEGKSPKTITWYTEMIVGFTRFLTGTDRRPVLPEFNISAVREFIIHEQERGLSAPSLNTNLIERFHSTLKQRTKVIRGFKNKKTARLLLDGFLVHYNYFRPHEALNNKTPAEVAGIKFVYKDWLDVVRGKDKELSQESESDKPQSKLQQSRDSPIVLFRPRRRQKVRKRKPAITKQVRPTAPHLMTIRGLR